MISLIEIKLHNISYPSYKLNLLCINLLLA